MYSQPLNLSNNAIQDTLNKENETTLDPQWATLGQQNDQNLYDKGLAPGSQGYAAGMNTFNTAKDQAYDSMYVADQGQGVQDMLAQYNEPLNALSALQSGSQVSQPGIGTLAPTSQTGVQGTNISGLVESNYAQQVAQSNAAMGGLFGLGGALGSAFMICDRRLKKDVVLLGAAANGLPLYEFSYVWGGPRRVGHMADEVSRVAPEAVFKVGQFDAVDYGRV